MEAVLSVKIARAYEAFLNNGGRVKIIGPLWFSALFLGVRLLEGDKA